MRRGWDRTDKQTSAPQTTAATSPCFRLGHQHFADQICFFTTHVHSVLYSESSQGVFYRKYHCRSARNTSRPTLQKTEPSQAGAKCRGPCTCGVKPPARKPSSESLELQSSNAKGKAKGERPAGMGSWKKESGNKVRNLDGSAKTEHVLKRLRNACWGKTSVSDLGLPRSPPGKVPSSPRRAPLHFTPRSNVPLS